MAKPKDISRGSFIRFNGELVNVIEIEHRTPGNLRAFYQAKMKNVRSGKSAEARWGADEDIDLVRVEVRELQYLYRDGDSLVCMDNETFDQIYIPVELFGDAIDFVKEEQIMLISFDGTTPIFGEIPSHVEMVIDYTEPGIKGDTATKTLKPATLENGTQISVPLFVDIGDKIRIDTRTRAYVERVK
jgi:elongation factor P